MVRTYKQTMKQIEAAKNFEPCSEMSLLEAKEIRDRFSGCWFTMIATAYNLGFLRGGAAHAKGT